jgi:hypothetical protein
MNPMQRRMLSVAGLLLMMTAMIGCGTSNDEMSSMKSKQDHKPSSALETYPPFHKRNSVMGAVMSAGKAVPGSTITIVATGESLPIESSGSYVLVLDPAKLGKRPKELLFAAPGYVEQRHSVLIPENKQVRLDVELVPAK